MSGKKSVTKNYLYHLLYQLFLLIVPIAVTPYVARVLGDNGSGQYSFAFSVVTYFTLFAGLGFITYGQREAARFQEDKHNQSIVFWEIFIARLVPTFITLFLYLFVLAYYSETDYFPILTILVINVIAQALDISFLFQANEEFKKMVLCNFIVKALGIVSIFIFVKQKSDLGIYTLIQSLTVIGGFVVLWIFLPKEIVGVHIRDIKPFRHLLPAFVLFLPAIAISVYTTLDKTLIGLLVPGTIEQQLPDGTIVIKRISDIENGNYDYAEKLVKMMETVLVAYGTVLIPKNSRLYAEGKLDEVASNVNNSIKFAFFLGVPIMLGCIAIADNFIPWYLGEEYTKAAALMVILAPLVLILGLSNVFGSQYLLPARQDKRFAVSIFCGAGINLLLNLFLIRFLYSYGAAIATVIAEFVVTTVMYLSVRKIASLKDIIKGSWKYIISGIVMFVPCFLAGRYLPSSVINTLLIAAGGAVVYFVMLFILKDKMVLDKTKSLIRRARK